jgi:hypothetical protein
MLGVHIFLDFDWDFSVIANEMANKHVMYSLYKS